MQALDRSAEWPAREVLPQTVYVSLPIYDVIVPAREVQISTYDVPQRSLPGILRIEFDKCEDCGHYHWFQNGTALAGCVLEDEHPFRILEGYVSVLYTALNIRMNWANGIGL